MIVPVSVPPFTKQALLLVKVIDSPEIDPLLFCVSVVVKLRICWLLLSVSDADQFPFTFKLLLLELLPQAAKSARAASMIPLKTYFMAHPGEEIDCSDRGRIRVPRLKTHYQAKPRADGRVLGNRTLIPTKY